MIEDAYKVDKKEQKKKIRVIIRQEILIVINFFYIEEIGEDK